MELTISQPNTKYPNVKNARTIFALTHQFSFTISLCASQFRLCVYIYCNVFPLHGAYDCHINLVKRVRKSNHWDSFMANAERCYTPVMHAYYDCFIGPIKRNNTVKAVQNLESH